MLGLLPTLWLDFPFSMGSFPFAVNTCSLCCRGSERSSLAGVPPPLADPPSEIKRSSTEMASRISSSTIRCATGGGSGVVYLMRKSNKHNEAINPAEIAALFRFSCGRLSK
ncbi:MAG: hypothetical protein EBU82_08010 [Flavobacteriia bacterium]|nr:hypothetical protein [Flavobacteriia bacterium]